MPYISLTNVVRLLAERYDNKSNVKSGGFWSQLLASYVSSNAVDDNIYIYIYIYIYFKKNNKTGYIEL